MKIFIKWFNKKPKKKVVLTPKINKNIFVSNHEKDINNIKPIKVIGVGGCGNNFINYLIDKNMEFASFVYADTDKQCLQSSKASIVIQMKNEITCGLGSGGNCDIGQNAAKKSREEIKGTVCDTNTLFIAAGMGGGIGTGAAPVIADIAKNYGIKVIAVVTMPFSFEGKVRLLQAELGVEKLRKACKKVIILQNDKLKNDDSSLVDAFDYQRDKLKCLCENEIVKMKTGRKEVRK